MHDTLATGVAALAFAAVFLFGGRIHPFRVLVRDKRNVLSFGGGMAAAYVFVHVMPELSAARRAFVESTSVHLQYEGMAIYFLALVGFLVFYGLDHMHRRLRDSGAGELEREGKSFRLHVGGFALYVWLMSYQLVHNLEETPLSIALFAVAVTFHFWGVDHALREEHGERYERVGRFVLAAMCVAGWAVALLVSLPHGVLALSIAFISGAIVMNSLIVELPTERDGRFVPFMVGGIAYGLILLPLG